MENQTKKKRGRPSKADKLAAAENAAVTETVAVEENEPRGLESSDLITTELIDDPTPPLNVGAAKTPANNAAAGVTIAQASATAGRGVRCRNDCVEGGAPVCDCSPMRFHDPEFPSSELPPIGPDNRIGRLADIAFESGYFGDRSPAQLAIQILAGDSLHLEPAQALFDLTITPDGRVLWKGGQSFAIAREEMEQTQPPIGSTAAGGRLPSSPARTVGVDPAAPEGSATVKATVQNGKVIDVDFNPPAAEPEPTKAEPAAEPADETGTAEGPRDDENDPTAEGYGTIYDAKGEFLGYGTAGSAIGFDRRFHLGGDVLSKADARKLFEDAETAVKGDSGRSGGPVEDAAVPQGEAVPADSSPESGETAAEINEPAAEPEPEPAEPAGLEPIAAALPDIPAEPAAAVDTRDEMDPNAILGPDLAVTPGRVYDLAKGTFFGFIQPGDELLDGHYMIPLKRLGVDAPKRVRNYAAEMAKIYKKDAGFVINDPETGDEYFCKGENDGKDGFDPPAHVLMMRPGDGAKDLEPAADRTTPETASAADPEPPAVSPIPDIPAAAEYPGDEAARKRIDIVLTDLMYPAETIARKLAEFDRKDAAARAIAFRQANTLHRDKLRVAKDSIQKALTEDGKPTVESQAPFFVYCDVPTNPDVWTYRKANRVLTTLGELEKSAAA